jgi:hypothetical protein
MENGLSGQMFNGLARNQPGIAPAQGPWQTNCLFGFSFIKEF